MHSSPLPPTGFSRATHLSYRASTTPRPLGSCCLAHVSQGKLSLLPIGDYSKILPGRLVSLSTRCVSLLTCNTRVNAWSPPVKRNGAACGAICTMALVRRLPRCTCRRVRFVPPCTEILPPLILWS